MPERQDPQPDVDAMRRALRRAALLTSGAGIAYGVLTIVAYLLLRKDREGLFASDDPMAYYAENGLWGSEVAGLYLLPFAAVLFLWFIVALRGWIRGTQQRRNMLISDLQLVSGVTFTAVFLVGAAAIATSVVLGQLDGVGVSVDSLRLLAGFGNALMVVMGVRIASVFVLATASLGMTTGVLPRWFTFVSYGFGLILMLTPMVSDALIVAFPIWVIALSIMLLYHLANVRTDEVPGFAERYGRAVSSDGTSD